MSLTDAPGAHVVVEPQLVKVGALLLVLEPALALGLTLVRAVLPTLGSAGYVVLGALLVAGYALLTRGTTERELGVITTGLAALMFLFDVGFFAIELLAEDRGGVLWVYGLSSLAGLGLLFAALLFTWKLVGHARPWVLWLLLGVAGLALMRAAFSYVGVPLLMRNGVDGQLFGVVFGVSATVSALAQLAIALVQYQALTAAEVPLSPAR